VESAGAAIDWRGCCGARTLGAGAGCGSMDLGAMERGCLMIIYAKKILMSKF
jgi:hypothetical protein